MKIKHFSGYGSVNAKKLSVKNTTFTDNRYYEEPCKVMLVQVSGLHEHGLDRDDKWLNEDIAFRWLLSKFDKTVKDRRQIIDVETKLVQHGSWRDDTPEIVEYVIHYKPTEDWRHF